MQHPTRWDPQLTRCVDTTVCILICSLIDPHKAFSDRASTDPEAWSEANANWRSVIPFHEKSHLLLWSSNSSLPSAWVLWLDLDFSSPHLRFSLCWRLRSTKDLITLKRWLSVGIVREMIGYFSRTSISEPHFLHEKCMTKSHSDILHPHRGARRFSSRIYLVAVGQSHLSVP